MDTKGVDTKISTGAVEKCALCSGMRQASAASTIPSTAGAKKASDHAFHVTIFGNTGMPMVRWSCMAQIGNTGNSIKAFN